MLSVPWRRCVGVLSPQYVSGAHPFAASSAGAVGVSSAESQLDLRSPTGLLRVRQQLRPLLIEHWLECTPSENPNTLANLRAMQAVLDVMLLLHQQHAPPAPQTPDAADALSAILRHIVPHFPFHYHIPELSDAKQRDEVVGNLNSTLCLLLSCFFTVKESNLFLIGKPSSEPRINWIDEVCSHVTTRLSSGEGSRGSRLLAVIRRYLAAAGSLVSSGSDSYQYGRYSALLEAFSSFYTAAHPQSNTKRECVSFIAEVLRLSHQEHTSGDAGADTRMLVPKEVAAQWLLSLPKLLWQLASSNSQVVADVLAVLGHFARSARESSEAQALYDSIQTSLVPLFYTVITSAQPKRPRTQRKQISKQQVSAASATPAAVAPAANQTKQIYGPFLALKPEYQHKCLDLVYYFSTLSLPMLRALAAVSTKHIATNSTIDGREVAVQVLEMCPSTLKYLLEVLHQRPTRIADENLSSLVLTVALGCLGSGIKSAPTTRASRRSKSHEDDSDSDSDEDEDGHVDSSDEEEDDDDDDDAAADEDDSASVEDSMETESSSTAPIVAPKVPSDVAGAVEVLCDLVRQLPFSPSEMEDNLLRPLFAYIKVRAVVRDSTCYHSLIRIVMRFDTTAFEGANREARLATLARSPVGSVVVRSTDAATDATHETTAPATHGSHSTATTTSASVAALASCLCSSLQSRWLIHLSIQLLTNQSSKPSILSQMK